MDNEYHTVSKEDFVRGLCSDLMYHDDTLDFAQANEEAVRRWEETFGTLEEAQFKYVDVDVDIDEDLEDENEW